MSVKTIKHSKITINIDGSDGNAFVLLGLAKRFLKQLKRDSDDIDAIIKEMQSGNYDNLLIVFQRELGEYVDFETNNQHYLNLFN